MGGNSMIKIYETDYVLMKDGKPVEEYDMIYHHTTIVEMINNGFKLGEGEYFLSMTDLPQDLKDNYIKAIQAIGVIA
jgi:hypothetical protein